MKKEDCVSELFFLFINLYADSTLFGGASSWIKVKNDSSKTYLKFRMDVLRKPAIKTLDIFKYDFQFRRTFFFLQCPTQGNCGLGSDFILMSVHSTYTALPGRTEYSKLGQPSGQTAGGNLSLF